MPFIAPIVAAVVGAVTAVATAASAIAANAALAIGIGSAAVDAISGIAFGLVEAGLATGAIMGANAILHPHLNVGGGGMQTAFQADPQAGVPYAIGRTGTGGNIVFADVAGKNNQDLTYVVVLSAGGPISQVEGFSAGGYKLTFGGGGAWSGCSGPVTGYNPVQNNGSAAPYPDYSGVMWQVTQLGSAGAAALTISGPSMPANWGASNKLSGFGAAMWSLRYDQKKYPTGTPKPLWVIHGAPAYDPRLDSTYPGGSGSQRSSDPTTWAYTENPFLHGLTWCLGIQANGQRILGVGAPVSGIDVAAFVQGANVADANGWKVGGVVYSTDNKWDVLAAMLQAGGGVPLKLGAKISCFVNTPRVSLDTLTGADVVGDWSVAGTQPRRQRINTIWPRYREESVGWELTPTQQAVSVASYATADGGIRSRQVDYLLVQNATQVSQLAGYDIENAREFGPIVLPCKPRWLGYRPGDCITVNEPEFGLNNQLVLIMDRQIDPATMTVTLTCRSETSGKHSFALGQTGSAPSTPGITGVNPQWLDIPTAGSWSVTGSAYVGAGQTPALIVDGTLDNPDVDQIIVDYRERLTVGPPATWGPWASQSFPASATRCPVTQLKDSTWYDVQVRYQTKRGVFQAQGSGLDLGTVQTGSIQITNQGLLALLNGIQDAQLKAGVGVNCLVDTDFHQGFSYWKAKATSGRTPSGSVATYGPSRLTYLQNVWVDEAVGDYLAIASDGQLDSLPVQPGDYVELRALCAGNNVSTLQIEAHWYNASGTDLGSATVLQAQTSGIVAGGGDISTYTRLGGFVQVPTNLTGVARVGLWLKGIVSSAQASTCIRLAQPFLAKARSGSTDATPYNPGLRGDPLGDQTSANISAGFTGQGLFATKNIWVQASAPTSGMNSQDWWVNNTTSPWQLSVYDASSAKWVLATPTQASQLLYGSGLTIEQLKPQEAGANVTETRISSGFTGQQNGATTKFSLQSTAPSSPAGGDQWVDTSLTPYAIKRWNSSTSVWDIIGTVGATTGTNLYSGTYGYLSDSGVYTPLGIAAGFSGQGALATKNNVDPSTSDVGIKGSIPPSVPGNSFTYSSDTSSVTISWPTITLYRIDGTTTSIASGSTTVSGLSSGHTYKVYPYMSESDGVLHFVQGGNGVGSTPCCYPSTGDAAAAGSMYARGNVPLNAFTVATASSGTTSGGGGGSTCPHEDERLDTPEGPVRAGSLRVGDLVDGPDGWAPITRLDRRACSNWRVIELDDGSTLCVSPDHRLHLAASGEVRAGDLKLGDLIRTRGDHAEVRGLRLSSALAELVSIELEAPHLYFLGCRGALCHNPKP